MKNPVLERLHRYGIRPRKDLGQHFLMDSNVLAAIVDRIDPQPGEVIVEFGPGLGVMTEQLLDAGAHVVGVELDDDMAIVLRKELGHRANFDLRHTDLAQVDTRQIAADLGVERLKVVGNLPYQLTSVVLFGLLELGAVLESAVFLVQREVAERIVSPPGSKRFGILSVLLQAFHDVQLEMRVKPSCFAPPPRVDSAVLRLRPLVQPALSWEERAAFIALVKHVFNERRKVLRNTLKKFYEIDAAGLESVAKGSGVDLGARPEALPIAAFVRLLHALPATTPSGSES